MIDTKRVVLLGALLFLVVGIVGVISLFETDNGAGVTGAAALDVDEILESVCFDSDGDNHYERGKVTYESINGEIETYEDYCEDSKILLEYSCEEEDVVLGEYVECSSSCINGACTSEI